MSKRFVSIWFRHLATDWFALRQPHLKKLAFVLRKSSQGRMTITATNRIAEEKGILAGMVLADARAILPDLEVHDDKPDLADRLLHRLAAWCIRFTPVVAIDLPDGLLFDATGCSHLWGGDLHYVNDIVKKLTARGYDVRAAMAGTVGAAWGLARFGKESPLSVEDHVSLNALMLLPPEALRLEAVVIQRLHKLGLHQIRQVITLPRSSLLRRFGSSFLHQLDKALGTEIETLIPVEPPEPFQERLPCLDPITTLTGIEIALRELLEALCRRLQQEQKGLRTAIFKGYRVDGKLEHVRITTNRPSHHVDHLFKLFEIKLPTIEPALGIELFVLDASKVEDYLPEQEEMWQASGGLTDVNLAELLDRLASKFGEQCIHRYLPAEHYWPERSYKPASSLEEQTDTNWRSDKLRPLQLLRTPEPIEVTAPIPDYPPMLFRYRGKVHPIIRADGPERIEQEWWLQRGQHRDYYRVEDEEGHRYWLFRLGHYHDKKFQWYLHGFFA
jgi:protein ImuB